MLKKIIFITLILLLQIPALCQQNRTNCDQTYAYLLGEEESKLSDIALYQMEWLVAFYTQADCVAAWHNPTNEFANVDTLRQVLATYVDAEQDFHLKEIDNLYTEIQTFYLPMGLFDYEEVTEFDILLSDAALQLAYNLRTRSKTNAENLENDIITALQEAIEANQIVAFYENLKRGIWLTTVEKDEQNATKQEDKKDEIEEEIDEKEKITTEKETKTENEYVKDEEVFAFFEAKELTKLRALNELLHLPKQTREFYENNNFSLIWQKNKMQTQTIVKEIEKADAEGLRKEDYHFKKIEQAYLVSTQIDVNDISLAHQDILLTDAILQYASHLFWGKLSAEELPFSWDIQREEKNMVLALQTALEQQTIADFFEKQKPQHRYYRELKQVLADFRAKENKQSKNFVDAGETLRIGMRDERVKQLRKKLKVKEPYNNDYYRVFGVPTDSAFVTVDTLFSVKTAMAETDLASLNNLVNLVDAMIRGVRVDTLESDDLVYQKKLCFNPMLFDTIVEQAVIDFQKRNALEADGIVGKQTLKTINTPFKDRIRQIEINLERWRWLPNSLGDDYLIANIPTFMLYAFKDEDRLTLEKRVVIGKKHTQTPVFSELVRYLDLNPYWTVPYSIATSEILPRLKRNAGYLAAKNMELFAGGKKINPSHVDWSKVNRSNFRYTIRQKPSKTNALGEVKFLFPNAYNVYLHDTPSKSLFANYERAYSHGCVRLEKPMELAEYLLQDNPKWTAAKLEKQLKKRKNKRIILDEPVPIYLVYLTAVSNKNGEIIYGNDIYNHDKALMKAFYQE